ncbi:BACON domain-containing protein [Segatella copri]|uniref:BACON domain-containing protein n=1 Tax=Segatella copri TaxID=165179 RepID=UPI00294AC51D|nr:BACON domain-containing protein [Segatella copri]
MKKIKHLMIWMGLLLCLVSCKDAMETIGLGGDEIPAEGVTLNIELPNFSEKKINTRAGADESISNVTAVFYGESNTYKGMANVNIGSKNADGTYQAKISKVTSGTITVHLVTNVSNLEETEAKDLQNIALATPRTIDTDSPICWGSVSLTKLLDGSANVSLLRQYAKVTLIVDDAVKADFPEEAAGLIINNTAAKSAIAPANYKEPNDALATTKEFSSTDVGDGTSPEVAVTETSAGVANVIIKAKYKGKEGYYKVGLYNNADKTSQYALLRNHNYTITVTKVNDYGFKTLAEAIKSDPENRIEAQIVDDNPAITKMIACKDYELGVSDKVYVDDAEATSAIVTVVTTLEKATSSDGSFYTVTPEDSWIHSNPTAVETNTYDGTNHSTPGKKYVLTFTLDKNDAQEESRTGKITVKSGDLMLTAQIIQKGYDFKRDDHRPVTLLDGSIPLTTDYFKWLDEVQGITPEEMYDGDVAVVRNEGLHFSPVNNTYSYLIKKLDGDSFENSDTRFTVEDNGSGYWKVTLKNSNDNSLWKSSFNIKHTARVKITYDVYHTGIFHNISNTDNQMAEDGETSKLVKGWFYYEVVKVKGNSGKIYLMLDRNLGASNNGPYIRETKALEGNEKAIGGYFYIATGKTNNLSSTLSPSGYEIPEMKVFEDLINGFNPTIQVVPETTPSGETYSRAEIKTVDSQLSRIYLPYGGYLENEVLRNPIHVDLWTQTPLSGTQGFAPNSPDYGFWYKYFDIYNKSLNFSNVRFVSGSDGKNTGRYKAMPLRLISKTVLSNPTL